MNVTSSFDISDRQPRGKSPADLALTVRDRRFNRQPGGRRHWLDNDPVASAWFTALSASFPRGEAMFIDAVKAHRDGVDERLAAEIRDFVRQEVNHSREHLAFNKLAGQSGYDLTEIDQRVAALVAMTQSLPPVVQLTITCALEHFTAMFAHAFLTRPEQFGDSDEEVKALWRWHAIEEIEHKAVAFDTWLHATRTMPRPRRWLLRAGVMGDVTVRFLSNRFRDALDLLAQEGIAGWPARRRLLAYLFLRPGILRQVFPAWVSWFKPGFHPWDVDDRDLIRRHESG
jgi:predicted metal-dependent hydrolase